MIPSNRTPTHPGEILREEFLVGLGIPQTELAAKLGIPVHRINEIANGKGGSLPIPHGSSLLPLARRRSFG